MTTRLEVEYAVVDKGKITKSRETLLELEDRKGIHRTEFVNVEFDVKEA